MGVECSGIIGIGDVGNDSLENLCDKGGVFNGMWVGFYVLWVATSITEFSCGCVDLGRAYLLVQRRIPFLERPGWVDLLEVTM